MGRSRAPGRTSSSSRSTWTSSSCPRRPTRRRRRRRFPRRASRTTSDPARSRGSRRQRPVRWRTSGASILREPAPAPRKGRTGRANRSQAWQNGVSGPASLPDPTSVGHSIFARMSFDWSKESLDREFPVRRNLIYFNHAAVAPLPRRVSEAIVAHAENTRDRGAADWRRWYGTIERAREKAARFVGADRREIAFLPSTSWALNFVARAYPWKPGDNVVGDEIEFPSNSVPWKLLENLGVEYRAVPSRAGRVAFDDIAARVDAHTKIVAVSWVAFHNGFVFPLEEVGRFCRERGTLFVLDAIQGLGALPFDVSRVPVDVFAADAHKWLLGQEACTIFYVREAVRDRVPAIFGGWWNTRGEEAGGFLGDKLL